MNRIYNFSAGPCTLPLEVLEQARELFVDYHGQGMSLLEMSHRTPPVEEVRDQAVSLIRELLGLTDLHHVIMLAGGATMQFGMIPMNLLQPSDADPRTASYTHSGAWAKKAIADAKAIGGKVHLAYDGTDENYTTLPDPAEVQAAEEAVYLHLTSNETIGGLQWKDFPQIDTPLIADMSSDFVSRPIDADRFGLIYAGTQKNVAPAGVTIVIIRDDLLEQCGGDVPNYMSYANHVKNDSMLNTPPVFQVWMTAMVLQWLKDQGGLEWAQDMAQQRSKLLYDAIANAGGGGFYRCPVDERYRSQMNVVFRLPDEDLEAKFIKEAETQGLSGLKGHRSVGGIRASIYNAMPLAGAKALADFMSDFADRNG
jgi:phosphoserine aminotransferase